MIPEFFNIGDVSVRPNLVLAPMSGVTNICFRRLLKELNPGCLGLVVTEFISIEGLTRGNEQSQRMMRFVESERPISIQIFGHEISRMVDAAKIAADAGADIVDINSGCPVPKVVKKGGGCELMRQPEHLGKMLEAVRKGISIPLTLKIRAGWDNKNRNALQIAKIAESAGVDMLAIHGRSRQDLYRGAADWDIVSEVAKSIQIPVIGSGDIVDGRTAKERLASGVQGVMIGRGALTNPWIFTEISAALRDETFVRPGDTATVDILERYVELLREHMTERAAIGRFKQLASQVTRRVRGSTQIRKSLCTSPTIAQCLEILARWREDLNKNMVASFSLNDSSLTYLDQRMTPDGLASFPESPRP